MNRDGFIREISRKSGKTIKDVKLVWGCVEDIFDDAIRAEAELNIRGFGRLYFTEIKKRDMHGIGAYSGAKRKAVRFRLSKKLKNIIKK